ncbi:MAG: hypothetical protein JSR18_13575 [Proteobacteria bacterium]|nr:hypothetical protein [Pseudomonadota bacterium]
MFGFSRSQKDPLADRKSAERWLAAFPGTDPLAMHAEVLTELGRLAERGARRSPPVLEAVFYVDEHTAALRAALTAQYIEHATRSSRIENQLWSALFDLSQAFLVAYQSFARDVDDHLQSNRWQVHVPELVARQVVHLAHDARIRLYRYEQWIPAKWAELHALFTSACSRQIERLPLTLAADGDATTIEHEYLQALLLQLMNAGNLTPRHLEWVHSELDNWTQPLRFALEPSTLTSFYVDLAAREGLKRRTAGPLEGRVLFLDTRPLHLTLMQAAAVVEQKIRHQPLSGRTPKRTEQLNLLNKLAAQVDPEFKPFARRGERTAAAGAVDAIVGFAKIAAFLREEERDPTNRAAAAAPGASFGGTMELAVFGRVRNEPDRRAELARQRLARFAPAGGPWDIKDVSQTGYRLVAPMSVANAVTLGTLAAIRPQGQATWTLGIVRRMRRLTIDRAEIGMQVIANAITGVDLVEHRRTAADDYSVDGEPTTGAGRTFQALFLAMRKRERETPVQSVIVPAVEYQPTKRFKIVTASSIHPIRFGRLIEQMADWVWTTIEPLGLDAPVLITPSVASPGADADSVDDDDGDSAASAA